MPLKDFEVEGRTGDGDKVTITAAVDDDVDVRVITTIPRGVVDDISPSRLATAKEREDFIKKNLDLVSEVIEATFRAGRYKSGGRDGHDRFVELGTEDLQGAGPDLKKYSSSRVTAGSDEHEKNPPRPN
jgi:hypothetical protein